MTSHAWPADGPFCSWRSLRRTAESLSNSTPSISLPQPSEILARFISPHDRLVQSRMPATRVLAPTQSVYSSTSTRSMIQRIILATSTCTILLVLVTFFFFLRMQQKRLRHKLVMLSILGCFIRGLWYFIFAVTVTAGRMAKSGDGICTASGFFIHIGNEMSGSCIYNSSYRSHRGLIDSRHSDASHRDSWRPPNFPTFSVHHRRRRRSLRLPTILLRSHRSPPDHSRKHILRQPWASIHSARIVLFSPHLADMVQDRSVIRASLPHWTHHSLSVYCCLRSR